MNTLGTVANDFLNTNNKILYYSSILLQNLFSKYMYNFHLSKNAQNSVGTNSRHAPFFILYINAVLNNFNLNPLHQTKNECWQDAYKAISFRLSTQVRRLRKSFFVLFILIVKPCLNNRMTWLCYFLLVPKDIEHARQFQCLTKKKKTNIWRPKVPFSLM